MIYVVIIALLCFVMTGAALLLRDSYFLYSSIAALHSANKVSSFASFLLIQSLITNWVFFFLFVYFLKCSNFTFTLHTVLAFLKFYLMVFAYYLQTWTLTACMLALTGYAFNYVSVSCFLCAFMNKIFIENNFNYV